MKLLKLDCIVIRSFQLILYHLSLIHITHFLLLVVGLSKCFVPNTRLLNRSQMRYFTKAKGNNVQNEGIHKHRISENIESRLMLHEY